MPCRRPAEWENIAERTFQPGAAAACNRDAACPSVQSVQASAGSSLATPSPIIPGGVQTIKAVFGKLGFEAGPAAPPAGGWMVGGVPGMAGQHHML